MDAAAAEGASELFTREKKTQVKDEGQAKEAELFQQNGRLQMELQWLKKISAALMPVYCASWSITSTPSPASAVSVGYRAYHDPRCTTGQHRCTS